MAERDFRFERHYELWKEQNKQVGRWIFWALVLAPLLLFRVLVPYTEFSAQRAAQQEELTGVENDLKSIEQRQMLLSTLDTGLQAIQENIEKKPWMVEKEQLKTRLNELNQAYHFLASKSVEEVRAIIAEAQEPLVHQSAANPAAALQLCAHQLNSVSSSGELRQLLQEQLSHRVQEEADTKVRRIAKQVYDTVINPLDELLRKNPDTQATLLQLPSMLAKLRTAMERWKEDHIGNRVWYQTIQSKDRELNELTDFLGQRQQAFLTVVQHQQEALGNEKERLTEQKREAKKHETSINNSLAELNQRMEKLLPDWVGGVLLKPQEMLQLYPFGLVLVVIIIGLKASFLRRYSVTVRKALPSEGITDQNTVVSSVWTLVYRGVLGTCVTFAVYLGGLIFLWWLFAASAHLLADWLPSHEAAFPLVKGWLPTFRRIGPLLFIAMMLGIAGVLLKDIVCGAGGPTPPLSQSRSD